MERFSIEEVFTVLKPLCDSLMKNPNAENARNLMDRVENISDAVIQDWLEYILCPITTHLQNKNVSKDTKEHLVKTMLTVIKKARIKKIELFNKLYLCLLIQIFDKEQPNMVIASHEELKEVVILCMRCLIHRCFVEVIDLLYVKENAPKLAQGIYLCVSIARTEKSPSLRLTAIETMMTLCQIDDESDKYDIVLQSQIADVVMLFLPGIASGLMETATMSTVQSHKITVMATKAWARVISLVMQDSYENDDVPSVDTLIESWKNKSDASFVTMQNPLTKRSSADTKKILESAKRDREWFNAAATKLNVLIKEAAALKKHPYYEVRRELASGIHLLLITCPRNMKPNVVELIEYLICLSEDDVYEVEEQAAKALDSVNDLLVQKQEMKPIIELLEESFYNLLSTLPRIIRMSDENEQLSCINYMTGFLRLLSRRLPFVMTSVSHVKRLILALVYSIEIDLSNVSLLEDMSAKDIAESAYYNDSLLGKRFKFINSVACKKIITMCKLLGQFGDLRILVDNIMFLMSQMSEHRKELVLLLNWIIDVPVKDSLDLSLYKEIIELYTSQELWYLPIKVDEDVTLRAAHSNVILCCFLTEGLGVIATTLKQHFDEFLLKTLYLIIERAGSAHNLIGTVGIQTLQKIAESEGHKSIAELLRANVDYYSYHVTMKLRRVERHPGVLDVVGIVMKYSTMDVLPCLKEIVQDVLLQLDTNFQNRNAYSFLKVFYTFMICIKKLTVSEDAGNTVDKATTIQHSPAKTVISSLLEYYEAKRIDERMNEDFVETDVEDLEKIALDEKITEDSLDTSEQQDAENIPNYIKMVEEVMKRCLHFLPSREITISLIAMSTLQEGLIVLAKWENQLLPIVHQLWHPLVDRFNDHSTLVVNHAFQLLCTLARVSKDFIRSRTLRQILPALSKFLQDSAKESCNKESSSVYRFTQVYKLQKQLLSMLGDIAVDLKLRERELWSILTIAQPYLSARQHSTLQEQCVSLYKSITDYNSDISWVKCLAIWNSKIGCIPTDASLRTQNLEMADNSTPNEYYKNVKSILMYIEQKSC